MSHGGDASAFDKTANSRILSAVHQSTDFFAIYNIIYHITQNIYINRYIYFFKYQRKSTKRNVGCCVLRKDNLVKEELRSKAR